MFWADGQRLGNSLAPGMGRLRDAGPSAQDRGKCTVRRLWSLSSLPRWSRPTWDVWF